jgi:hypothetical protein
MTEIDLARATDGGKVGNLAGKERGISFRELMKLDSLEESGGSITVKIPDEIYLVTDSWTLGAFSQSVRRLGSIDSFLTRFQFSGNLDVARQIVRSLSRVRSVPPNLI